MKITNNFRFDELCFILFAFFKNNASDDNNQIVALIENDLILLAEYTGIPSAVNNVNFEVKRVINLFTTFNSNSNSNSDTEVGIEDDLELVIFKKFSGSLVELENFIYSVKAFINLQICSLNLETFKASEGQGSTYKHFARERDARIVKTKPYFAKLADSISKQCMEVEVQIMLKFTIKFLYPRLYMKLLLG